MAVTIRDVANAAGVSPMAVSKVLHDRGANVRVGTQTAALIRRIASELNYQPNELARSFRRRRTQTIGLVFDNWSRVSGGSQYFAHLLDGIAVAAFPKGYSLTICPQLVMGGESYGDGRFDGLLWAKFESTPENLAALKRSRKPVVLLHAPGDGVVELGFNTISCDNRAGIGQAVEHLAALGHKRIGFVSALSVEHNDETLARIAGMHESMARRNLQFGDEDIFNWGYQADEFSQWWASNPPQTALVLRSESMAGKLFERAAQLGVRIPRDLSVVGFDSTAYCDALDPRLTSISQPIEEMAKRATELLLEIIDDAGGKPQQTVYPCGFDVRESTAPPRP